MKSRFSVWKKYLRFLFLTLFLITGFLHISSFTAGQRIISFFQWPAVCCGGAVCLLRLVRFKEYVKNKLYWCLALFLLSFFISSLVFYRYGFYENLRNLVFTAFQFFVLFAFPENDPSDRQKEWEWAATLVLIGTFLLSAASLVTFFAGYQYNRGGVHIGVYGRRLFGAWWDPNYGSAAAALAPVLIAFFAGRIRKKPKKISVPLFLFLSLDLLVQFFYTVLSDSHTGRIVFTFTSGIASLYFYRKFFSRKCKKKRAAALLALLAAVLTALLVILLLHLSFPSQEVTKVILPKKASGVVMRRYAPGKDISNGRFRLWHNAFALFLKSPLLGVSRSGIIPYTAEFLPEYASGTPFQSMHNLFFDILATQGALGILFFGAFGVWCAAIIIRKRKTVFTSHLDWTAFSIAAALILSAGMMTEILYVITPSSTLAWLSLSLLVQKGMKKE